MYVLFILDSQKKYKIDVLLYSFIKNFWIIYFLTIRKQHKTLSRFKIKFWVSVALISGYFVAEIQRG